jgi:hypothetical protein
MTAHRESFVAATFRMSAGIVVWAAHFAVIYGYAGLACARRFGDAGETWVALVPWVIGVSTAVGAVLALALMAPLTRERAHSDFAAWMGAWLAAFALAAILLEAGSLLWVPACA